MIAGEDEGLMRDAIGGRLTPLLPILLLLLAGPGRPAGAGEAAEQVRLAIERLAANGPVQIGGTRIDTAALER